MKTGEAGDTKEKNHPKGDGQGNPSQPGTFGHKPGNKDNQQQNHGQHGARGSFNIRASYASNQQEHDADQQRDTRQVLNQVKQFGRRLGYNEPELG